MTPDLIFTIPPESAGGTGATLVLVVNTGPYVGCWLGHLVRGQPEPLRVKGQLVKAPAGWSTGSARYS